MTYKTNIFRCWYFWTLLLFIAGACGYFNWTYFREINPLLTIQITADKNQIEKISKDLCKKYNLGPQEDYSQISHFNSETTRENHNQQSFPGIPRKEIIDSSIQTNLYQLYTWQVRHFKEGNLKECLLKFTPDGIPYGFIEQIPENESGPTLTIEEALRVAENFTDNEWNIDLHDYKLIESSHQERVNGRTDYTFIFERKHDNNLISPHIINEFNYGLILCVYGNKVTAIDHFIEIPETSSHGLATYPAKKLNDTFNTLATALVYFLYTVLCFIGLSILMRTNYLLKNPAIVWGILLALAQFIFQLSSLSDIWINYHISQSAGAYLINNILGYIVGFLFYSALYALVIMIAEGLTRAAFPQQVQLWKFWNKRATSSFTITGTIIGSYLLAFIYLAFILAFYFFSSNLFYWPYTSLIPLNSSLIGHFAPAISVLTKAISEGFWKEMLFRAIPIGFFTLIGQKIGLRKTGITLGFIIQACIVGIAHGSYLALLGYIGFIEPLISSFFFGLLYIYFGLMPGIIIHYICDAILMSLTLFRVTSSSMFIQKIIIVIGILIPFIILVINVIRTFKIAELSEKYLNGHWIPLPNNYKELEEEPIPPFNLSMSKIITLIILVILSCSIALKETNFNSYEPKFNVTRDQALDKAKEFLAAKEVFLDSHWETLTKIILPKKSIIKYIWQNFGQLVYKKLDGNYIKHPAFEIKFTKFEGLGYQRAEEYTVLIDTHGKIESCQHTLSEDAPGKILSENDANHLAISVVTQHFRLNPTTLKIITSVEIKRPVRKDWIITINDTSIDFIGSAQAHIIVKICGDEITSINRKIHTPKEWLSYKSRLDQFSIIFELLKEIILFLIILIAFFQVLQTAKSRTTIITSIIIWLGYLVLIIINTLLTIPEITAYLNTAKSFYFQIAYTEFVTIAKEILTSFSILILALNIFNKKHQVQTNLKPLSIVNINLGIIATGLSTGLLLLYKNLPTSYSMYFLNSYNPLVCFMISNLVLLISRTLTILFIAQYARFTFSLKTIFAVIAITLLIVSDLEMRDLHFHLLVFAIMFIILLLSHLAIIRYNTLLVPLILVTLQVANLLQEFIADPFVDSQHTILVTISILGMTTLLIIQCMHKVYKKKLAI